MPWCVRFRPPHKGGVVHPPTLLRATLVALLGAHVATAGGVSKAPPNAASIGCEALQLFVKNPNRWQSPALSSAEVTRFREACRIHGNPPVVAHASYLINLAASNPETLERSRAALADELGRCHRLGVRGLVLHPGAHLGSGVEAGLDAVARSLEVVLSGDVGETAGDTQVWLENTAGQGTVLGRTLDELAEIIGRCEHRERLGVCIDTCHAFAAGYEIHREDGLRAFLEELEDKLGTRLGCFHLNDSQHPLGSRRDRHANIGEGELGTGIFLRLLKDRHFADTPMLLETPRGEDKLGHARDLKRLRELEGSK